MDEEDEEERTWRRQAAIHSQTETNKNPTLHWIFLILLVFVLFFRVYSCLLHAYMSRLAKCMHSLFFCQSLCIVLLLLAYLHLFVNIVNILISIWMLRVFQSAFIDSTSYWYFKNVSGQYSSLWSYLLSLLYTLLFNKHLLRKKVLFLIAWFGL